MLERLQAAGVYDPAAPDAGFRRSAAQHLHDVGIPFDDIVAILGADDPEWELVERVLFPGPRVPYEEFAERVGLSLDRLEQLRLAAGLPPLDRDTQPSLFSSRDEFTFAAFNVGAALMGEDAVLRLVRVMGSALAQIAEAAVSVFGTQMAEPLLEEGASPDVLFNAQVDSIQSLVAAGGALDTMFRFHVATAIRRLGRAREGQPSFGTARLTVGFIDLVGFTELLASLDVRELRGLFDEFETKAFEVIAAHDARLVKLIGDAVMFTALDPAAACEIALTLVEEFSDDSTKVTPRGALAHGDMLARGGDYYGPVVNLAARAADLAVPLEILVTDDVVAVAGDGFRFEPAGRRRLKGFAEPVALAALSRDR